MVYPSDTFLNILMVFSNIIMVKENDTYFFQFCMLKFLTKNNKFVVLSPLSNIALISKSKLMMITYDRNVEICLLDILQKRPKERAFRALIYYKTKNKIKFTIVSFSLCCKLHELAHVSFQIINNFPHFYSLSLAVSQFIIEAKLGRPVLINTGSDKN